MEWTEKFKEIAYNQLIAILVVSSLIIFASLGGLLLGFNPWQTVLTIPEAATILTGMGSVLLIFLVWLQLMKQSEELTLLKKSQEPNVKVTSHIGLISSGSDVSETIISFTAANIGNRPVTLSSCGIDLDDNLQMIFLPDRSPPPFLYGIMDGFPKRLEIGASHTVIRSLRTVKGIVGDKKPKFVWFKDETDNKYMAKWHIKLENFSDAL